MIKSFTLCKWLASRYIIVCINYFKFLFRCKLNHSFVLHKTFLDLNVNKPMYITVRYTLFYTIQCIHYSTRCVLKLYLYCVWLKNKSKKKKQHTHSGWVNCTSSTSCCGRSNHSGSSPLAARTRGSTSKRVFLERQPSCVQIWGEGLGRILN